MSWFLFSEQNPRYRKGVCLRARREDNPDVFDKIDATGLAKDIAPYPPGMPTTKPLIITVCHVDNKRGTCSIKAYYTVAEIPGINASKAVLIYIEMKMNPKWVCEGDVGRGYKK